MSNTLIYNKEINIRNVLLFTIPTMVRMIFISMYSIVDGIVVSNYVGSVGLSAINIVYPVLNVCMALSFMLGTGSNAIIGKKQPHIFPDTSFAAPANKTATQTMILHKMPEDKACTKDIDTLPIATLIV